MNVIRVGGEKIGWVDEKTDLAFWSTISYRLEPDGKGTKFPILLEKLSGGSLKPQDARAALVELEDMERLLKELSIDQAVSDMKTLGRVQSGVSVRPSARSLYDYFIDGTQKPLVVVLKEVLQKAEREQTQLTFSIRRTGTWQSRLFALLFIAVGVGLSVKFYFDAIGYNDLDPIIVLASGACIPMGIAGLIWPDSIAQWGRIGNLNKKSATIQGVALAVGVLLGIGYLYVLRHLV